MNYGERYKLLRKKREEYHREHEKIRKEQERYMLENGILLPGEGGRTLIKPYAELLIEYPELAKYDERKRIGEERIERNRREYSEMVAKVDEELKRWHKPSGPFSGDEMLTRLCVDELEKVAAAANRPKVTRSSYRDVRKYFTHREIADTLTRAKIRYVDMLNAEEARREMAQSERDMRRNSNDFSAKLR